MVNFFERKYRKKEKYVEKEFREYLFFGIEKELEELIEKVWGVFRERGELIGFKDRGFKDRVSFKDRV